MTYVTPDKYGRREMNLEAFGRDLATALGYPLTVEGHGSFADCTLDAGDGLTLILRAEYGAKLGRVSVYCRIPGAGKLDHHQRPNAPNATVDSSRDMTAIAKDVMRRVVEPGRLVAAETAELVAKREATCNGLKDIATALMAEFPGLSINTRENETRADVYFNQNGCYLTGNLEPDGRLSIQRFSVDTPERARALFTLIAGKG